MLWTLRWLPERSSEWRLGNVTSSGFILAAHQTCGATSRVLIPARPPRSAHVVIVSRDRQLSTGHQGSRILSVRSLFYFLKDTFVR